jgi:DNA-binding LytR/AlgR family response regulator
MTLTCLAVDDEPLALGLVCAFIEKTPFLKLEGRYSSAVEALHGLHERTVDVLFLDIQMPDLTGLELARILERSAASTAAGVPPRVIFTTAFNQFALEGYRVDALDYLLKPFNYEEFLRAATKARAFYERLQRVPAPPLPVPLEPEDQYLFLKSEYQLVRVALDDVLYVEGLKDYVKVFLKSQPKPLLTLSTLKALEEKLPPRRFLRIHRSFIVALDKIGALTRNTVQIGAVTIPVTDQYKEAFGEFLKRWG